VVSVLGVPLQRLGNRLLTVSPRAAVFVPLVAVQARLSEKSVDLLLIAAAVRRQDAGER